MPAQPHDGFTIQIGSTPSETYAQEMAKSFLGRGFQAYVASVTIEGKTYYRVPRDTRYTSPRLRLSYAHIFCCVILACPIP